MILLFNNWLNIISNKIKTKKFNFDKLNKYMVKK